MRRVISRRRSRIVLAVLAVAGSVGGGIAAATGSAPPRPDHPPLPPAKAAIEARVADYRARAGRPAPKNPDYAPAPDPPQRPKDLGVIRTDQLTPPVPPSQFTPTTEWMDWRDGKQIQVYAGLTGGNAGQGTLFIWEANLSNDLTTEFTFYTPSREVGSLRLTSVDGNVVHFSFPGGSGSFNLVTKAFALD